MAIQTRVLFLETTRARTCFATPGKTSLSERFCYGDAPASTIQCQYPINPCQKFIDPTQVLALPSGLRFYKNASMFRYIPANESLFIVPLYHCRMILEMATTVSSCSVFPPANAFVDNFEQVSLQLWDTAGQERFRSMAPMYYRGATAAIIVFDTSKDSAWDTIKTWQKARIYTRWSLNLYCRTSRLTLNQVS